MLEATRSQAPTFSVLMPVYNGASHLREALDSVLMQTFSDFEIIPIDDGSTDDSWKILREYALLDDRVRPHQHETNRGHCETSNTAIRLAKGRYLTRLDQDDLALPQRLEATAKVLDDMPAVGFVYSSYLRWLPDGTLLPRHTARSHTRLRFALLFNNVVCHSSVTVRRELIDRMVDGYRDVAGPQDYDFWIRAVRLTLTHGISEPVAVYRHEQMAMTALYGDRIEAATEELSLAQIANYVPRDCAQSVRRLYNLTNIEASDWSAVRRLHEVFQFAAERSDDLDPVEVSLVRRRWTAKALRATISSVGPLPKRALLVAALVRHDPRGAAQWVWLTVEKLFARKIGAHG